MTGAIEGSGPPLDVKTAVPRESSDMDRRHSHQEVFESGSNETGVHESEKDIPVRPIPLELSMVDTEF